MNYSIQILEVRRRDHIATANALELRIGEMLDPNSEAAIDRVRTHRLHAEELARAILLLRQSNVVNIEASG